MFSLKTHKYKNGFILEIYINSWKNHCLMWENDIFVIPVINIWDCFKAF